MIKTEQLLQLPGINGWQFAEQELKYQFAIWGKNAGTQKDYGIIAKSLNFELKNTKIEDIFYLGRVSDKIQTTLSWRVHNNTVYVQKLYWSHKVDHDNREILEAIVLCSETKTTVIPASIQALLLLPLLDSIQNADFFLKLPSISAGFMQESSAIKIKSTENIPPLLMTEKSLSESFNSGIDSLKSNYSQQDLAFFYEILLEQKSVSYLPKDVETLAPSLTGVLLAFLPRPLADQLSIIERVPASGVKYKPFKNNWNGVLAGGGQEFLDKNLQPITSTNRENAKQCSQALFSLNSEIKPGDSQSLPVQNNKETETNFTVWGSTSSGKSAYIIQLFLNTKNGADNHWEISLRTEEARQFIEENHTRVRSDCRFPDPTLTGKADEEHIELGIKNRQTGVSAVVLIDDRAGVNYENMTDELVQTMVDSSGLLILLDTSRSINKLEREIDRTFNKIRQAILKSSGLNEMKKYALPVAFCLTKIDFHIHDTHMLKLAQQQPHEFAKELVLNRQIWESGGEQFFERIAGHCENYRLFPVSAIGLRVDRGVVENLVFYDNETNSRVIGGDGVQAINLLAPFTWLVEQSGRLQ